MFRCSNVIRVSKEFAQRGPFFRVLCTRYAREERVALGSSYSYRNSLAQQARAARFMQRAGVVRVYAPL